MEISTALVLAVAGAAVLAARAFRHLAGTVIELNNELRKAAGELRVSERENTVLEAQVSDFDSRMAAVEERLNLLGHEVHQFKSELEHWRQLLLIPPAALGDKPVS